MCTIVLKPRSNRCYVSVSDRSVRIRPLDLQIVRVFLEVCSSWRETKSVCVCLLYCHGSVPCVLDKLKY